MVLKHFYLITFSSSLEPLGDPIYTRCFNPGPPKTADINRGALSDYIFTQEETISYSCATRGHRLIGVRELTCHSTGQWTSTPPTGNIMLRLIPSLFPTYLTRNPMSRYLRFGDPIRGNTSHAQQSCYLTSISHCMMISIFILKREPFLLIGLNNKSRHLSYGPATPLWYRPHPGWETLTYSILPCFAMYL